MKKNATALFIFCCIWSTAAVHHVQAAACPTSDRYAMVNYNHNLLNRTASPVSTFSQGSSLLGPVGIEIGPAGITNAGNNVVQRTMEVLITDPDCDCHATGESNVTVSVQGSCVNGVLNMRMREIYPSMTATGTCVCPDEDPPEKPFSIPIPGTTTDHVLTMNYVDGATVVQPYTCDNCSGSYSWRLQFTSEPPPPQEIPLTPLVPLLYLLLQQVE